MKVNTQQTVNEEYRETELGDLPREWDVVRFDDVAKYINGYPFKPSEWKKEGVPIIRIQNLTKSTDKINHYNGQIDDRYKVKTGDLLISWSASLGVFIWDRKDAWLNQHIFKVTDFSPNLDKKYFYFVAGTRIQFMKGKTHGSTMHHITKKEFEAVKIPLPPLQEQQNIAYVLSTVQEAQQATEQVINSLKELKKSLMKHLFTYGAVSFEDAGKVKLKETEIGKVPEGWEIKPMIDVATFQRGNDLPKQNWTSGAYPIIGSSGIMGYHKDYTCDGDGVITGRSGSIGKLTYITSKYWAHNTALYVKNFHGNNPKFIYYQLLMFDFKKYATGVSVPTLNRNFIHSALLKVPPISEQQQIASILSSLDEKIETEEKRKLALTELFNSLLKNLMTAKIRVKDLRIAD